MSNTRGQVPVAGTDASVLVAVGCGFIGAAGGLAVTLRWPALAATLRAWMPAAVSAPKQLS